MSEENKEERNENRQEVGRSCRALWVIARTLDFILILFRMLCVILSSGAK